MQEGLELPKVVFRSLAIVGEVLEVSVNQPASVSSLCLRIDASVKFTIYEMLKTGSGASVEID